MHHRLDVSLHASVRVRAKFAIQGGDKTGRGALVEEFLQCNGKWLESSIVMNHRLSVGQRRRGEYRLMSRQDTELNFMCFFRYLHSAPGTIHIYIYIPTLL